MHLSQVATALDKLLLEKATAECVSADEFNRMDFRTELHNNPYRANVELHLAWRNPYGDGRRGLIHVLDNRITGDLGRFGLELRTVVDQLSIRGELHYFKLHKYFPDHLSRVQCLGQGRVAILFKIGQGVATTENNMLSQDFIATCAMLYDL